MMEVDDCVDILDRVLADYFRRGGAAHSAAACRKAVRIIRAARTVKLDGDRGDDFLVLQLAAAAQACDSALLDLASRRIHALSVRVRQLEGVLSASREDPE